MWSTIPTHWYWNSTLIYNSWASWNEWFIAQSFGSLPRCLDESKRKSQARAFGKWNQNVNNRTQLRFLFPFFLFSFFSHLIFIVSLNPIRRIWRAHSEQCLNSQRRFWRIHHCWHSRSSESLRIFQRSWIHGFQRSSFRKGKRVSCDCRRWRFSRIPRLL